MGSVGVGGDRGRWAWGVGVGGDRGRGVGGVELEVGSGGLELGGWGWSRELGRGGWSQGVGVTRLGVGLESVVGVEGFGVGGLEGCIVGLKLP